MRVDERRVWRMHEHDYGTGLVLYWMQRDQRAEDNWALLYAQERALERNVPLVVVFNLVTSFGGAPLRAYDFMLKGLQEVEKDLRKKNIPFVLLTGDPTNVVPEFISEYDISELIIDFNPMRTPRGWQTKVVSKIHISSSLVDAHNIVPCWRASDKLEFAAYTFRPKIHKQLKTFLTNIPSLRTHPYTMSQEIERPDWDGIYKKLSNNTNVQPVDWITPGTKAGKKLAKKFIQDKLSTYHLERNDPNKDAQSHLSPYLHFGQISAQWVANEVQNVRGIPKDARDAFLEELIVRRELADNYCYYNSAYDKIDGAHEWAKKTIEDHKHDKREYVYSSHEFETAQTHDELWNAMQRQMVTTGKMHGWCRMYWAKKILEWTPDAQTAIDVALYLNDTYELDGRDPNGVVGVMWSICGVHDRAWNERPVFGKVRYMNFAGAKRKFDVQAYINRYSD